MPSLIGLFPLGFLHGLPIRRTVIRPEVADLLLQVQREQREDRAGRRRWMAGRDGDLIRESRFDLADRTLRAAENRESRRAALTRCRRRPGARSCRRRRPAAG